MKLAAYWLVKNSSSAAIWPARIDTAPLNRTCFHPKIEQPRRARGLDVARRHQIAAEIVGREATAADLIGVHVEGGAVPADERLEIERGEEFEPSLVGWRRCGPARDVAEHLVDRIGGRGGCPHPPWRSARRPNRRSARPASRDRPRAATPRRRLAVLRPDRQPPAAPHPARPPRGRAPSRAGYPRSAAPPCPVYSPGFSRLNISVSSS